MPRLVLSCFVAVLGPAVSLASGKDGVFWQDLDLAAALSAAEVEARTVMVEVWADWCAPCRRLDDEVWGTTAGATLAEGTVPIRVDFDSEAGQALKRERTILGVPTVLFLRPDGAEIDRIVGYEEKEAFLAEARTLVSGDDPLPELLRLLQEAPDDPARMLAVGRRQLQRGETEAGLSLLRSIQHDHPATEQAAEAYFLEGRFLHRVREDPVAALPVWLRLARNYRESPLRPGGISWALRAYADTDRIDEGWTWIRRLAAKDGHDGWAAYFAARYALEHDRRRDVAQALLSRARQDAVAALSEETIAALERSLAAAQEPVASPAGEAARP